jgi:hypothetical protein
MEEPLTGWRFKKFFDYPKPVFLFIKQKVRVLGQPSGGIIKGEIPLVKEKTGLIFFVLSLKKIVYFHQH